MWLIFDKLVGIVEIKYFMSLYNYLIWGGRFMLLYIFKCKFFYWNLDFFSEYGIFKFG